MTCHVLQLTSLPWPLPGRSILLPRERWLTPPQLSMLLPMLLPQLFMLPMLLPQLSMLLPQLSPMLPMLPMLLPQLLPMLLSQLCLLPPPTTG